jgi:response regulator RpfG family c-di-GMP phosphodiesterase
MNTTPATFTVLLLEDDNVGAKMLGARFQKDLPDVRLLHARTIDEGQSLLAEFTVDFFIVDVMLPDGSGFDFVADIQTVDSDARVLLISATFSKRLQQVRVEAGVQHVMPKPLDLRGITSLVGDYIAERDERASAGRRPPKHEGFVARLQGTGSFDVIQFRSSTRMTTMLEFSTPNFQCGKVYLVDGQITHAETDGITGMEALVEILSWNAGTVREVAGASPSARTIVGSTDVLLMHAVHQIDERRAGSLR